MGVLNANSSAVQELYTGTVLLRKLASYGDRMGQFVIFFYSSPVSHSSTLYLTHDYYVSRKAAPTGKTHSESGINTVVVARKLEIIFT